VLVNYAWVAPRIGTSFVSEVQHTYEYPPKSALLQQIWTHPSYRGRGLCTRALKQILNDTASIGDVEFLYVAVSADNRVARRVIEKLGFKYQNSVIREVRFGTAKSRLAAQRTLPQ
jgi:predicted GNAT family acetyltransferase